MSLARRALSFSLMLLALWCGAAQTFGTEADDRYSGEIRTYYDGQKDRTFVIMTEMLLDGDSGYICRGGRRMIAEFSYPGKKPQPPAAIALGFFTPPFEHGLSGAPLTATVDGARLELGKLTLDHDAFYQWVGCRNLYDTTGLLIPRETFLRLVNAKQVELRANDKPLPLTEKHFAALKNLAERMGH